MVESGLGEEFSVGNAIVVEVLEYVKLDHLLRPSDGKFWIATV
jgi:hypothetical protein